MMPRYPRIVTLETSIVLAAQAMISACEICDSKSDIPFEWLLSYIQWGHPDEVAYFMREPAYCPRCGADIAEETQVLP